MGRRLTGEDKRGLTPLFTSQIMPYLDTFRCSARGRSYRAVAGGLRLAATRAVRPPVNALSRRVAAARDAARLETYHRLSPLLDTVGTTELDRLLDVDPESWSALGSWSDTLRIPARVGRWRRSAASRGRKCGGGEDVVSAGGRRVGAVDLPAGSGAHERARRALGPSSRNRRSRGARGHRAFSALNRTGVRT